MDPERLRHEIATILNQHDSAFRALREAREFMRSTDRGRGDALAATRQLVEGVATANAALEGIYEAHGKAIDAALAANSAALALLRELNDGG